MPATSVPVSETGHAGVGAAQPGNLPDTAWSLNEAGTQAFYGTVGPGIGRSIKPDLHHTVE